MKRRFVDVNHFRQKTESRAEDRSLRVRVQQIRIFEGIEEARADFALSALLVERPLVLEAVTDADF